MKCASIRIVRAIFNYQIAKKLKSGFLRMIAPWNLPWCSACFPTPPLWLETSYSRGRALPITWPIFRLCVLYARRCDVGARRRCFGGKRFSGSRLFIACGREEPHPTLDDSRSPLAHVARLQRTPPRVRMMLARAPQRLLSVCMKPHVVALKDVVSHYTVRVGVCSLYEASMCV
jgi:hypothetical protein